MTPRSDLGGSADGRPAGLCLLGAPGTDHSLLTLAHGLETSA